MLVFEQQRANGMPKSRILQAQDTKSQLFLSMTPTVLSGLLVALFLIAGIGLGYQAGDMIMAEAGFGQNTVIAVARDDGGMFVPEDVL